MKAQVTNQDLFNAKQVQVDIHNTGKAYNVSVSWIEDGQNLRQEWDGEFGRNDFETDFGFQLTPDSEEEDTPNVWTYFVGTNAEARNFAQEWESLLGTEVSYDLTSNKSGEEAWYCTASVTQEQIDEFNMDQDWFTK
jgi:hypothetical protein